MALEYVWAHPDRREVEETLYITLRMMHLPGWRRLVFAQPRRGRVHVAVTIDSSARENDARDWSQLFDARYRVAMTVEELIAGAAAYTELYIDAGFAALLNEVERQHEVREQLRREEREGKWWPGAR